MRAGANCSPLPQPFFRHTGYITAWETGGIETRDELGVPTTVYLFEWVNPHPGKKVIAVDRSVAGDIIVCRILAASKS